MPYPVLIKKFLVLTLLMTALGAMRPGAVRALSPPAAGGTWQIFADHVTVEQNQQRYDARGTVTIIGETARLTADHVVYDNLTADAYADGHVRLISGKDNITCDAMTLNLKTETGTIHQGTVFVAENHFYITGERIEKTGKATYRADRAALTSCDGDRPDWKITGREISVTIEGYGTATHATLWAGGMPALYTPFLLFPAKNKRQTGLLAPRFTTSTRKGFEYEQPLFIALSRNSDTTLDMNYMADRGTKLGAEYRYISDKDNRFTLYGDYLRDDKIDDGTDATDDYSYAGTPDRTNQDRYWLRMKADLTPLPLWKMQMDLDYVSDADYLHEFKKGVTDYTDTNAAFERDFGRDLDEYDDTTRKNRINLKRSWSRYNLNMDLLWYDNVSARREDTDDTTLQSLPDITLNALRRQMPGTPLYFKLNSGYTEFYRRDTTDSLLTGRRLDVYPRLYLPLHKNGFQMEPSLGLRQTLWHTDDAADIDGTQNGVSHRELYDISMEVSTMLSRIFAPDNAIAEKIKHEITPTLTYTYLPEVDQSDNPWFDDTDSIDGENTLTWELGHRFTSRRQQSVAAVADKTAPTRPLYREIAWLTISQDYHFSGTDEITEKAFSPIEVDLEFSPMPALSLDSDFAWSPYENRFVSHNTGFTFRDGRNNSVNLQYRYDREDTDDTDNTESIYTRVDLQLTSRLRTFMIYEKNLQEKTTIEATTGVEFNRKCWSLEISYTDTTDDRSIGFLVNLKGIGEFGNQ